MLSQYYDTALFRMAVLVPEFTGVPITEALTSPTPIDEINKEIDTIIRRLLTVVLRRSCADARTAAHDFIARKNGFDARGPYAYLNDPYLRTFAIAGEEHLRSASSNRELQSLFALREELLARVSRPFALQSHDC